MGLDGIEMVMQWEEAFGLSLSDAEAAVIYTPRDAINRLAIRLNAVDHRRHCLTLRAYHLVRQSLIASGVPRASIRPGIRLKKLLRKDDAAAWARLREICETKGSLRSHPLGRLAEWIASTPVKALRAADSSWSRSEIREIVRSVVRDQLGVKRFRDDADFVRDLGLR